MIQYFKLRLELLGFWIFSELYLPDSGFGISSFCKSVWIHRCWEPKSTKAAKKKRKKKRKETRNIKKKLSVNKISHGKNVAYTLDICFLKMDKASGAVQGNRYTAGDATSLFVPVNI